MIYITANPFGNEMMIGEVPAQPIDYHLRQLIAVHIMCTVVADGTQRIIRIQTGGHLSGRTGEMRSHIAAILRVFVITISSALSLPKYSNSLSISSVVRKYSGA